MKKIKLKIESLGLNYNKELIIFVVIFLVIIGLFATLLFLFKSSFILIIGLITLFVFVVFYFYRYLLLESKTKEKSIDDFIEYFSYFRIYIFNGEGVYSSLNKTIDFANRKIKPLINGLLAEIDQDKSINPYLHFSNNFNNKLVEEIMISIFEMVENGSNFSYINQFTTMFENFKLRNNKANEEKRISIFDRYITTSLIGSGLIMIILVFGIVNLIGEVL
jgi:Predicted signaling protein consisting of a modified GGDEF domain and a DHH domain